MCAKRPHRQANTQSERVWGASMFPEGARLVSSIQHKRLGSATYVPLQREHRGVHETYLFLSNYNTGSLYWLVMSDMVWLDEHGSGSWKPGNRRDE